MFSKVIDTLIETAERNNVVNEGDYYNEKGLLHCGKCRTPKQVEVTVLGEIRRPFCMCGCEAEKLKEEEEERQQQELRKRINETRRRCFNDEAMQGWT